MTGLVDGEPLEVLLTEMNNMYIPSFMKEKDWTDTVRKEFQAHLHKFMATLEEMVNSRKKITKLYIPMEDLSDTREAAKDKDLVQRLESMILHWTKQIKNVVLSQDSHQEDENAGPLEEISYWKDRQYNLSRIHNQLEQSQLKKILTVLDYADSSYLQGFQDLTKKIKDYTLEADNSIKFLETLKEPCKILEGSELKNIPDILPDILNRIRMIWELSEFYNTSDRICGLLTKVSNEIIKQCKKKINIDEILDGDVIKCIQDLNESINCGEKWKEIFNRTMDVIKLKGKEGKKSFIDESSHGSIFAQIDAFVQRCRDLNEVCECQLQFAKKDPNIVMPEFSGTKGSEITNNLNQLERTFAKKLETIRKNKNHILDVRNTKWHDEYIEFKTGIKNLEIIYQNTITLAFKGISTVQEAVDMLENFEQLAKRPSIKDFVNKSGANIVLRMFQDEIKNVEAIFDSRSKTKSNVLYPLSHPYYAGTALWVKALLSRLDKSNEVIYIYIYIFIHAMAYHLTSLWRIWF